jgi:hypothetical protein
MELARYSGAARSAGDHCRAIRVSSGRAAELAEYTLP